MKALTIRQPWATLIALGEKKIETRSWKTIYRGSILIHAGKSIDKKSCLREPIKSTLKNHGYTEKNLPTGVIIAKCQLIDCIKIKDWVADTSLKVIKATLENAKAIMGNELEFGDFTPSRYAWILDNVELLKDPIPAKGKLSLWKFKE